MLLRMNMTREQEPMSQVSEKLEDVSKITIKTLFLHSKKQTNKKTVSYRIVRVGWEVQIFF